MSVRCTTTNSIPLLGRDDVEKKSNHQVNIGWLGEPRVHSNADSLEIFDIGDYQVVTKKGNFKAGDRGVYIQPDSVVPQTEPFRWIWEAYVGLDGTVPEKRRRITVKRLRGEWSEGLLLPDHEFPELESKFFYDGDDVSELLGITHYDPDKGKEPAADDETFKKKRSKYPRSLKGWWYLILHKLGIYTSGGQNHGFDNEDGVGLPVFDVDALKHYKNAFDPEELVEVTEKIHGSNARFMFRDEHMYAGSRTQWKAENANCIWRNVLKAQPWIEEWCRAHPGYGLYGEVTPTQGEKFQYGSTKPQFFAFDIRHPEGYWCGVSPFDETTPFLNQVRWVPQLYTGLYKDIPWELVDGRSMVDSKTMREGLVIRPVKERHVRGLGRLILKVVSNKFLEKDK
jgi:hypothetical protein